MVDNVITIHGGVHSRKTFQSFHTGAYKKGHKTESCAFVLLFKSIHVLVPKFHHSFHVDLVKGRQHGGGLRGLKQALSNLGS